MRTKHFFDYRAVLDRPFSTPQSTADWMKIPEHAVVPKLKALQVCSTTQPGFTVLGIIKKMFSLCNYTEDKAVHLVLTGTDLWIDDGHHRMLAAAVLRKKLRYRVYVC